MGSDKDSKVHIRQRRPSAGPSLEVIREREANWERAIVADPDTTYCGHKGTAVYGSVDEGRKAGVLDEDFCTHCAGWDTLGVGSEYWANYKPRGEL